MWWINNFYCTVVKDENLKKAVQYLKNEEQVGFATVLLGCQLTAEELPQIPDNEMAKDVEVVNINPVKDVIEIRFKALKEQRYKDGWKWEDLEEPVIKSDTVSYSTYMKYSKSGYKA